jgi:hypothetical protein
MASAVARADDAPALIAKTLARDDARQQALRTMQYDQAAAIDQLDRHELVTRHVVLSMTMKPGATPPWEATAVTGDHPPALADRAGIKALADDVEGNKATFTLHDLASRFIIAREADAVIDGTPAYVLAFKPRPGQPYRDDTEKVVNQLAGRAWISAATFTVLRIEADLPHPVRVAWFFARVPVLRFEYRTRDSVSGFAPAREKITLEVDAPFVGYHERQIIDMTGFRAR